MIGRCWHDVTLVEHVLGAAGAPAAAGRLPLAGLRIGLEAVASEMRSRGLVVHVGAVPGGAAGPALPVPVSAALAQAVREALANVLSHAGTGEAWVDIAAASGADPWPPGGLRVTVRDTGPGFDPAPGRSVPARAAPVHHRADRGLRRPGGGPVCARPGDRGVAVLAMLTGDGLVQETYAAGLPRMAAGVALVWQFAILIQVLVYRA